MTKIDKPKGLIRYASHNGIQEQKQQIFTKRMAAYSVVLVGLIGLFSYLLASRTDVESTMMRVPGMLYQEQENNRISNLYNIQFINKTFDPVELELRLKDVEGGTISRVGGEKVIVPATGNIESVFFIEIPKANITQTSTKIDIELYKGNELIEEIQTSFVGPISK